MCFSATASFAAAAATGIAGGFSVSRVARLREVPLASIPFVFAIQQAVEGGLWLSFQHQWPHAPVVLLANMFVFLALVVWPILSPTASGLAEPDDRRFPPIIAAFVCGLFVAGYSALDIFRHPYFAEVAGHSLCYINNSPFPPLMFAAYALATCGPFLVSSHRPLQLFGAIVVGGMALSLVLFFVAFVSVWCFFAAAGSVTVCAHFLARQRLPAET